MKFVIGEKDFLLMQKIKSAILALEPPAEIVECYDWDCTLLDLIRSETADFLFLDLNIMGVTWKERVMELLQSLNKTRIVLTAKEIDIPALMSCFEHGIVGFIPYSDMDGKLKHILDLIFDFGIYVPPLILTETNTLSKEKSKADKSYRLPDGSTLTKRQIQVLNFLHDGLSNKQIAAQMGITEPTVKLHIHGLFHKLGATNRTQIVLKAQNLGFF